MGVEGLGYMVQGIGFRENSTGLRVEGVVSRVYNVEVIK